MSAAIPALEQLCRRFAGFGLERPVPEQVAAIRALGQIGSAEATHEGSAEVNIIGRIRWFAREI